jgi:hypothetical protein
MYGIIKNYVIGIVFTILVLILSTYIQVYVVDTYISSYHAELIEKEFHSQGIGEDRSLEDIIEITEGSISKETIKTAFAYSLLISWLPWFILGFFLRKNKVTYSFVFLMSLVTYESLWFTPIVFLVAFYFGSQMRE